MTDKPAQVSAPESFDLDLGDGHWLRWTCWKPDRSIPSNAERFKDVPDDPRCGAIVTHTTDKTESGWCEGSIMFSGLTRDRSFPNHAAWTVESWEPLTLSPSLLCGCGDHGFIRGGKWVRA
jgi:hypothetical protein